MICSSSSLAIHGQCQHRKGMPVVVVLQVEHLREPSARGEFLIPAAVFALMFGQPLDALQQTAGSGVAAGQQPQHAPRGLRWRTRRGRKRVIVVAGAAFAPSAVGVLNGTDPFACAKNMRLAIAFAGRFKSAKSQERPVNVIHAPAAIPASVRFLRFPRYSKPRDDGRMVRLHSDRTNASITRPVISGHDGSSIAL